MLPPIDPPFPAEMIRTLEQTMKQRALDSAAPVRRYRPEKDGYWDGYRFAIDPSFPEVFEAVARHRAGGA